VYTEPEPPPLLPRERLTRKPIKVIVKSKKISLNKASRLNLSKPQSIEHNLPVAEIGKVSKEDLERITKYALEYLKAGIKEAGDSPDPNPDDDDDDEEEEEEKEESEEDEDGEEEDKVPDNLNQRPDRNRHGNYLPPPQFQNRYPSDLPERPQTTGGMRPSQGRPGWRRKW
jgi:uncharacterized protein DUF6590